MKKLLLIFVCLLLVLSGCNKQEEVKEEVEEQEDVLEEQEKVLKADDYLFNLFTQDSFESVVGFSLDNKDKSVQILSYGGKAIFNIEPGKDAVLDSKYNETHNKPTLYKDDLNLDAGINVMMMWAHEHIGELDHTYGEYIAVQVAIWAAMQGNDPSELVVRDDIKPESVENANKIKELTITLYNERNNESWKGDIELYNVDEDKNVDSNGLNVDCNYTYKINNIDYYKADTYAYRATGFASVDNITAIVANDSDIKNILADANKNVVAVYVPVSEVTGGEVGTKYLKVKFSCDWKKSAPLYLTSDDSQTFMMVDILDETKETTLEFKIVKK